MRSRSAVVLVSLAGLAAAFAARSDKPVRLEQEPRYDQSAVIDVMALVMDVRDTGGSGPLSGLHLLVKTERETLDVYLAPDAFLTQFGITFAKGDRVEIAGSKIKFEGRTVVLARDVRKGDGTIYLRDRKGEPNWRTAVKPPT
jgi:hypothetical protein